MTSPINNKIITLLEHYEKKMKIDNDYFRQRAYKNAKNNILTYKKPINSFNELKELKIKGIGKTILNKIEKYLNTGVLSEIKNNPITELMKVHGIGYKKAEDLYKNHKIENNTIILPSTSSPRNQKDAGQVTSGFITRRCSCFASPMLCA